MYLGAKRKTYLALLERACQGKGLIQGNSFGLRHILLDRVIEKIDVWTHVPHLYCVYVLLLNLLKSIQTRTHTQSHVQKTIDFCSFELEYKRSTLFFHLIFDHVDDFIPNGKICHETLCPHITSPTSDGE